MSAEGCSRFTRIENRHYHNRIGQSCKLVSLAKFKPDHIDEFSAIGSTAQCGVMMFTALDLQVSAQYKGRARDPGSRLGEYW